jgi:hypothetical protein
MKRFSALLLTLGLLVGLASGPLAQPAQASSLKVCGEVTVYVKATAVASGLLTINGISLVTAVGASLPSTVAVGADLCADLSTNVLGLVTGAAVSANVHMHVKVCGTVVAYAAATATATGLLKIGSRTFTLALGSHLPATVQVGADLCADLELDGFARVAGGTVTANAHVHLKVCGEITAYAAATATATGLLKVGSHAFTLAIGSNLPAAVQAGADLCLDLQIDGYGRVSDGTATADVQTHVKVCGTVTAYSAANATATGLLKIAGRTFVLAVDSELPALVDVGADLCLDLTVNAFGQVGGCTAVANVTATLDACGQVSAYVTATGTTDGSLTVAGVARKLAPGADVDAAVHVGAYLKLRLNIDVFGRIAKASVLKVGISLADACDAAPAATENPGASPGPGSSGGPDASSAPGGSPEPGTSPGSSPAAAGSPAPSQDAAGLTDCGSGIGATTVGLDDTIMPSTDAIGRVTGIVAANILPLLGFGLLGGAAAWYRSRRRPEEEVEAAGIVEDVSSDDETAGDRS